MWLRWEPGQEKSLEDAVTWKRQRRAGARERENQGFEEASPEYPLPPDSPISAGPVEGM